MKTWSKVLYTRTDSACTNEKENRDGQIINYLCVTNYEPSAEFFIVLKKQTIKELGETRSVIGIHAQN